MNETIDLGVDADKEAARAAGSLVEFENGDWYDSRDTTQEEYEWICARIGSDGYIDLDEAIERSRRTLHEALQRKNEAASLQRYS